MHRQDSSTSPDPHVPAAGAPSSPTPTAGARRRVGVAVDLSNESAFAVRWSVDNYIRLGDAVILIHRGSDGKLGSVSDYCVHHCICPVVVVRYPDEKEGGEPVVSVKPLTLEEDEDDAPASKPVTEEGANNLVDYRAFNLLVSYLLEMPGSWYVAFVVTVKDRLLIFCNDLPAFAKLD
ncbi:hypothetical protein SAY86_028323 [Trapa natans]|uniref:UspA domain-containing protein n=1 Tax=Trapa natans TaxID=22666 RepID=A0AAN7MCP8_TRANT|nr:hypothetical protein SAY86_028323 [Trapa natans]